MQRDQNHSALERIAVIGAGAWGSALALNVAKNGHDVRLWTRSQQRLAAIDTYRVNADCLPDCPFPSNIHIRYSLQDALDGVSGIVIATPSSVFTQILKDISAVSVQRRILWACKGFSPDGRLLSDIAAELGFERALISGPNFATEVAQGLPAASVIASDVEQQALYWQHILNTKSLRCYSSDDLVGVQICGGCKNIIAIAAGISDGKNFGANARSALITRGLNEIRQLSNLSGGKEYTTLGLAGIGDLILTATDNQSRNRRFGFALASNGDKQQNFLVEGMLAATIVEEMAQKYRINLPICHAVHEIVHRGLDTQKAFESLMARPIGSEYRVEL